VTYPTPSRQFPGAKSGKAEFDNSDYQTYPPSVDLQSQYYNCLAKECNGDTFDYPCLQKCRLKVYRRYSTYPDHADWTCYPYRNDQDKYYRCLANVYAQYRYP